MSAPMHGQVEVSGFSVIPVKSTEQSTACHYLYAKEHAVRDTNPKKPRNRTLFLLNVPPYCSEECVRRVFSKYGKIENIFLHKNPTSGLPDENQSEFFPTAAPVTGFKVVYIVFKNAAAVQRVLKHPFDDPIVLSSPENPLLTGIQKWCTEYVKRAPRSDDLQKEATDYLAKFDKRQEEEEEREKDAGEPDEDGWVTVTRHSRHKGAPRTEAQERKVSIKEKKKRKRKELLNFYAFQVRETKKEQIADLRQRFEEDKQKIAMMKASRKFRPY